MPLDLLGIYGNWQTDSETITRQKKAVQKMKQEFEEQGVDFEEFWEVVRGVEGMPGMEIAT